MNQAPACQEHIQRFSIQGPARWWRRVGPRLVPCLVRYLGPYLNLFCLLAAGLAMLSVSRIALVAWQHERVEAAGIVNAMFVQGIRADLILLGYFLVIPLLLAPFLAHRRSARLWTRLTAGWATFALVFIGFMELASPQFIMQYDVRPNRLFVEYLAYPAEVSGTLWHGYRLALLLTIGATLVLAWGLHMMLRRASSHMTMWPAKKLLLTWPLLVLVALVQIRSTTAHRPANPALFALSGDALVNSLVINSAWSVLDAIGSLRKEASSSEIYGRMPREKILAEVTSAPWLRDYRFTSAGLPTLHAQHAALARERPLNLVIVLEESLGATFVQSLGGLPVTPELEKLKHEGWWFEQLYATGTRSVRGIEAVVAGYAPTPARSVVKLSLAQQNFYTLALGLGKQGYQTEFVYGGEAHFDNMRSFFTGNGFQNVVDRGSMQPRFEGSWGASDEDLFDTSLARLKHLHAQGKPFFSLIFTSSNHEPFEFPDGKIALHDPVKQSVNNAVKYADFALGKFIRATKQEAYWRDTVFLIVADHDNRVYGDSLVPIKKFHIPGLILGAGTAPRRIQTLASQIDLGPTLLSLLGVSSTHPMIGRDLTQGSAAPGRAMLQFDNYFAWLEGSSATILRPGQRPLQGRYDAASGALALGRTAPDQALVDRAMAHVMLPGLNGLEMCQKLRGELRKNTPVLMLTARDTLEDKVAGFESGADDYLVKPFSLVELEVRLKALVRRAHGAGAASAVLAVGDLVFNTETFQATRAGTPLALTRTGYTILKLLMRETPKVVPRDRIEHALWGDNPPDTDALRVHIHALRQALDKPFAQPMLHTIAKVGYKLVAAAEFSQ